MAVTAANPTRKSGYEDQSHMPNMSYVRRFAERNLLSLRTSSEIKEEISLWQRDTELIRTRLPLTWYRQKEHKDCVLYQ